MGAGLAIAVWLLGVTHASASEAGDSIGEVAAVEGQTVVIRSTERQAESLSVGSPLYQRDIVRTQDDSKAKLVFDDDSIVTLGENTTLEITEYVYSPETGERSSLLTVAEGIFRAVIDQIVPDSRFEVQTLTTVASVRATDWMAEATPDATAVVALTGAVAVRNVNAEVPGEVILGEGEGTAARRGAAPSPADKWRQSRVASLAERTALD